MRTVLSTKKSLFDPFEVEVDGAVFKSRPFNKALFTGLTDLEAKAKLPETPDEEKITAVYDQLSLIFGIPKKVCYLIDIRDAKVLLDKIRATLENPVMALKTDTEKNGLEPKDPE